ncbi:MAG TPA: divalent-cation tolerance protein CutA [Polyangiaceae bacterium]
MTDPFLVYVTAANQDEARRLGKACVVERLAACANVFPSMESFYHWEGELQTGSESVVILKTTREILPALTERLRELHSYSCPAIVAIPIEAGHGPFLEWIRSEVAPRCDA